MCIIVRCRLRHRRRCSRSHCGRRRRCCVVVSVIVLVLVTENAFYPCTETEYMHECMYCTSLFIHFLVEVQQLVIFSYKFFDLFFRFL